MSAMNVYLVFILKYWNAPVSVTSYTHMPLPQRPHGDSFPDTGTKGVA